MQDTKTLVKELGSITAAAEKLGVARSTVKRWMEEGREVDAAKPAGKTLDDFRRLHDKSYIIPKKIQDFLKEMPDLWEYESEICKKAGVAPADLAPYRDQFEPHIVFLRRENKRAWGKTPAIAASMREMQR